MSTKVCLVKAMVFPVVMYGCESWTVKKVERWRIDAFELWCWRRLLRVPWSALQSILEISPGCSLKGLMLKLKLQFFGHLMWRADSFEKTLMLGGIEGRRRRGRQRMRWLELHHQLNGYGFGWTQSWWRTGRPGVLRFMGLQRVRHDWATELNWTATLYPLNNNFPISTPPVSGSHYSTYFSQCFISLNFTTLSAEREYNHTKFVLLPLSYFTWNNVFEMNLCYCFLAFWLRSSEINSCC